MRIALCSVHVTDPVAAHAFYTGTLGFTSVMAVPEMELFIVRSPDTEEGPGLMLEPSDNPVALAYREGLYAQGVPTIVFGVDDVAAEYERLAAAGARLTGPPTTDLSGTHVTLDDTCGNWVQLHQPAAAG